MLYREIKTLITAMLLGLAVWLQAADWPNWRGPEHNGISQETDWFEKWDSSGPKRLWDASVGTGVSTVSVADGRVFTMGNKSNRDTVYALEESTGEILWRHSYSEPLSPLIYDGGPSATPAVDGEYVYTLSKTGKAFCLEASTGDEVWNRDLKQLYMDLPAPTWGFASSPLIHGDKVVYNVSSRGIALSKTTGSLKWKTASGTSGYATPVPYDHRGTEAFIMFGPSYAYGVNAATGKQLWSKSFKSSDINAADPVLYNGKIFLTSSSRDGELIELSGTSTSSQWKNRNMRTYLNAGVVIGDYLYGADSTTTRGNKVRCINMETGETEWTKSNIPCASITAADGKLIILSHYGDLYIAEASPSRFMQLAMAKVITGTCLTVPILANRSLYVRNSRGTLYKLQMSEMVIEPQPLAVNIAGSDLEFSWPAKGNFALESTDALGQAADWSEVGSGTAKEDDRYIVRVRPSAGQQFFRLRSE